MSCGSRWEYAKAAILASSLDAYASFRLIATKVEDPELNHLRALEAQGLDLSSRDSWIHFTASVMIVHRASRLGLFTLHAKHGTWQQLGGHTEGNFDLLSAAAREGLEESGLPDFIIFRDPIDVDMHSADCSGSGGREQHIDVCFAAVAATRDISVTSESIDLRWMTMDDLRRAGATERVQALYETARQVSSVRPC